MQKMLLGYHGWLADGFIKDYCRINNLHFLYKYIDQYSSGYWCRHRLELLNRVAILERGSYELKHLNKGVPGWERTYMSNIKTSELRRLDKIIRHNSFDNLVDKVGSSWAEGVDGRLTSKFVAHSDWAREVLLK